MVKIPAVVDSACLIGLERIGRIDLLSALLDPIIAPPAILTELGKLPDWISVVAPKDLGMVAALRLTVDPGESEAIALAYERNLRIILDDLKGRQVAKRLGIPVTGTVGLLLKAKQNGVIPEIGSILDALDSNQFRIVLGLRSEALRLAGEN